MLLEQHKQGESGRGLRLFSFASRHPVSAMTPSSRPVPALCSPSLKSVPSILLDHVWGRSLRRSGETLTQPTDNGPGLQPCTNIGDFPVLSRILAIMPHCHSYHGGPDFSANCFPGSEECSSGERADSAAAFPAAGFLEVPGEHVRALWGLVTNASS